MFAARCSISVIVGLVLTLVGAITTFGQDVKGDAAAKADSSIHRGDPVKAAFALPKSVVLTSKQQQAYDRLKSENAEALRAAADHLQQAKGAKEEAEASKKLRDLRAKIRQGIQEILASPYADAGDKSQKGDGYKPQDGSPPGSSPPYSEGNPPYPRYSPRYQGYYPGYYPYYPMPYAVRRYDPEHPDKPGSPPKKPSPPKSSPPKKPRS